MKKLKSIDVLGPEGELSHRIDGFKPREAQLQMSEAIEDVIKANDTLLVEAGTGTGKTFAYLVPSILSGKKTVISTGTKNLQDQLFEKDLPVLKKFLPNTSVLLKGRANYLCLYRLELTASDGLLFDKQAVADLQAIQEWKPTTKSGDIAECSDVSEDSSIWPQVTSTTHNCLGQECPFFDDCYLVKARKKAQTADVVIVNHHLFFADLAIKEEGFGEILPTADIIVFDEAHQMPEVASTFFSTTFSSKQVVELCHDVDVARIKEASDDSQLQHATSRLEKTVADMRLAFGLNSKREAWTKPGKELEKAIENLSVELEFLLELLDEAKVRGPGLASCHKRLKELSGLFEQTVQEPNKDAVHWFETYPKSFMVHITPISIQEPLQQALEKQGRALVLTSATLTVNDSFKYFTDQLGIESFHELELKSTFDYQKQCLMYLPRHMPAPSDPSYTETLLKEVLPVIEACEGRTFLLFTSHQAVQFAKNYMQEHCDFPLLIQGDQPKHLLLKSFTEAGNAVLIGTYSFWEGVDVRGDALSCVVIDKLPFASPKDPLVEAKSNYYKRQGLDPFKSYQCPQAVISLKQGAGRLIRDHEDRGVLVIADPRLTTRRYGNLFFNSLPKMKIVRSTKRVNQFIENGMQHEDISV